MNDEELQKMDAMFNEVFTRLRVTERITAEQGVRIEALTGRIEGLTEATDKFIEHLTKQEERSEKREQNFFKALSVLIGAIIVLAVGPKVAKEIMTGGKPIDNGLSYYNTDLFYNGDNNRKAMYAFSDGPDTPKKV